MHPPTPYPAHVRSKSKPQNEARNTAFREITARANAVSKSEQDFSSVLKKTAEDVTGKRTSKTPTASRRYSVASKFGGPKADNANVVSSGLDAKPVLHKRASCQGVVSGPQFNNASTQVSLASRKSTAVPSKLSTKGSSVPSLQANNLGALPKRQSLAPEQAIKLHRPTSDLHKRSASGYEKVDSTLTPHTVKARGMLLKSAYYWLEQVILAEAMEKHGVSIGFFRLAVECEAEPIDLLRDELIAYIKRYSLWSSTIQQVLLCYDVTDEFQDTLFSHLADTAISGSSSPCTPAKNLEGIFSSDMDPADEVSEKHLESSDGVSDSAMPKGGFDSAMPKDTLNVKEEVLHSEKTPVSDATGHIESMDADSLTREVVSYIMSSLDHSDSSIKLKNDGFSGPKDDFTLVCSAPNNHASSALVVADNSAVSAQESISILISVNPEEVMSNGSVPSLNVWNTLSKEADAGRSAIVQEEVPITLENDIDDSFSTAKVTGEEMCVSMELDVDDTLGDNVSDLATKSPTCEEASSEESKTLAAQIAGEAHGDAAKASDFNRNKEGTSANEKLQGLSKSPIHNKNRDNASEIVQVSEKFVSSSWKGSKVKSLSTMTETEKCTASQTTGVSEPQGNRSSSGVRHQNRKEKSAPVFDRKKMESPAPNKGTAAAAVSRTSRRLSISTPRSSTSAHTPNVEAGSRTRSKSRISQPTEPVTESNNLCLKGPIAESDGFLATPRQARIVEVENESKQVSSINAEGMDARTTDIMGLMATPGSAGLRRSARLVRPSEGATGSTPSSVSALCLQERLGTPLKVEK